MTNKNNLIEGKLDKLESILFESICIKGKDGKCDRSQQSKLFIDEENIKNFFKSALKQVQIETLEGVIDFMESIIVPPETTWRNCRMGDKN